MLSVRHIDAFYGDVQVLFDINAKIREGELVSIIGPNSAGKSTLLNSILGLVKVSRRGPASGIFFNGADLTSMRTEKIIGQGIAIVPEGAKVFPDMSVYDNLYLGGYIRKNHTDETLEEIFVMFPRLKERLKQQAKTLSGGERQMLCIGRALMSNPRLIVLDEPSFGLQPSIVLQIFDVIKMIHERGVTILLVEQNVNHTLTITERTYVLEHGKIVREGNSEDLIRDDYVRKTYLAI
ncbi:MAG: ABC transporter ATP-binding protein [Syntrophobacterales bacterium]|jgi:branched-chain amino acid transport system ATP-binding protein|nr:ABC transporter ATP-binding protein [Syntrophobacterales bacterium]